MQFYRQRGKAQGPWHLPPSSTILPHSPPSQAVVEVKGTRKKNRRKEECPCRGGVEKKSPPSQSLLFMFLFSRGSACRQAVREEKEVGWEQCPTMEASQQQAGEAGSSSSLPRERDRRSPVASSHPTPMPCSQAAAVCHAMLAWDGEGLPWMMSCLGWNTHHCCCWRRKGENAHIALPCRLPDACFSLFLLPKSVFQEVKSSLF